MWPAGDRSGLRPAGEAAITCAPEPGPRLAGPGGGGGGPAGRGRGQGHTLLRQHPHWRGLGHTGGSGCPGWGTWNWGHPTPRRGRRGRSLQPWQDGAPRAALSGGGEGRERSSSPPPLAFYAGTSPSHSATALGVTPGHSIAATENTAPKHRAQAGPHTAPAPPPGPGAALAVSRQQGRRGAVHAEAGLTHTARTGSHTCQSHLRPPTRHPCPHRGMRGWGPEGWERPGARSVPTCAAGPRLPRGQSPHPQTPQAAPTSRSRTGTFSAGQGTGSPPNS